MAALFGARERTEHDHHRRPVRNNLVSNRVFPPHRSLADAIGTSIYDYVSSADQERVRACVAHVLLTGEVSSYEVTSPELFGSLSFSVHVGPVRNGDEIVGVTLVTWDITERVRLQAQPWRRTG